MNVGEFSYMDEGKVIKTRKVTLLGLKTGSKWVCPDCYEKYVAWKNEHNEIID